VTEKQSDFLLNVVLEAHSIGPFSALKNSQKIETVDLDGILYVNVFLTI
jgi:hypothetical protein